MKLKQQSNDNYTVYVHTNKANGKRYVGITRQTPNKRWQNGHGYDGAVFGNAINKYGWDGFIHEVVMSGLSKEEACNLEITFIKQYRSNEREYGYNISEGGQTCDVIRPKSGIDNPRHKRVKMVDTQTGEVIRVFDSQSSAAKIMGFSRKSITKACRGLLVTYKGYVWEYADDNYIKPEHSGRGNYEHNKICKPIIMVDEDGEHYFESIKKASDVLHIKKTNISRYLNGSRGDKKRRWYYAS